MAKVPILGQPSIGDKIDALTDEVVALLEEVPLGAEELIGIIELSLLDTISNLAGYVHEMQTQIMRALGGISTPGEPTAQDFVGQYVEDYTLLRMARTQKLLAARLAESEQFNDSLAAAEQDAELIDHDKNAVAREAAVHDALDAEGDDGG